MATYSRASDVMADIATITRATPNLSNFTSAIGSIRDAIIELNRIRVSDRNDTLLSFVNKAQELRRADRIIAANPGVFESRSQALAWSEKAQSISRDAGENRLQAFMKQYGSVAGRNLFTQENAQLFTSRMNEIGRSPRQQRIQDYYEQFGGAASPDAMTRAEEVVSAEDRQQTRIDRLKGLRAYRYDTLDDFERERYDLTKKYGSRSLAEEAIRRASLEKLPNWMKVLTRASTRSAKDLYDLAKNVKKAEKIPIIGKLLKSPAAVAFASLGLYGAYLGRSDQANTRVVDWQNAANLAGMPSKQFSDTALLAGAKDPADIARRFGKATLKYGDAEMFYRTIGANISTASPLARMAMAQSLGLDETDIAIMDLMSGRMKPDRTRRASAGVSMANQLKEVGLSSGADIFRTLEAWRLSIPGMASSSGRDYADFDYAKQMSDRSYHTAMSEAVGKAVSSAEEYSRTYGTGASNTPANGGGKVTYVTVNTGDVVLPNAKDGKEVAEGLNSFQEERVEALHSVDGGTL